MRGWCGPKMPRRRDFECLFADPQTMRTPGPAANSKLPDPHRAPGSPVSEDPADPNACCRDLMNRSGATTSGLTCRPCATPRCTVRSPPSHRNSGGPTHLLVVQSWRRAFTGRAGLVGCRGRPSRTGVARRAAHRSFARCSAEVASEWTHTGLRRSSQRNRTVSTSGTVHRCGTGAPGGPVPGSDRAIRIASRPPAFRDAEPAPKPAAGDGNHGDSTSSAGWSRGRSASTTWSSTACPLRRRPAWPRSATATCSRSASSTRPPGRS